MAMNPVGGNTTTVPLGGVSTTASTDAAQSEQTTASGNMGPVTGQAPAAAAPLAGSAAPELAKPDPLVMMASRGDMSTLLMILRESSAQTQNSQLDQLSASIKDSKATMKLKSQDRLDQINKAMEKEKTAEKPGFWGKLFGWVSKAFSYIAQVATLVVGAALVATGVGAAAGVAMLAFGIYSVIGTVGQIVNSFLPPDKQMLPWSLGGLVAGVAKLAGASDELANKIASYTDFAVTIVSAVAMFVPRGVSAIARVGDLMVKKIGPKMMDKMSAIAQKTTTALGGTVNTVAKGGTAITAGSSVVSGASGIGGAVSTGIAAGLMRDAKTSYASAKDIAAEITKLQAQQEQSISYLENIIEALQTGYQQTSKMIASTLQAQATIATDMGGGVQA